MIDTSFGQRIAIVMNKALNAVLGIISQRHVLSITLGRSSTSGSSDEEIPKTKLAVLLARTLARILQQKMCDTNECGRLHRANFYEVLKPRLALIIPQGIRAPPDQLYSSGQNTPIGAFFI